MVRGIQHIPRAQVNPYGGKMIDCFGHTLLKIPTGGGDCTGNTFCLLQHRDDLLSGGGQTQVGGERFVEGCSADASPKVGIPAIADELAMIRQLLCPHAQGCLEGG